MTLDRAVTWAVTVDYATSDGTAVAGSGTRDGARVIPSFEVGLAARRRRREGRSWEEKVFRREESAEGRTVTVWGM